MAHAQLNTAAGETLHVQIQAAMDLDDDVPFIQKQMTGAGPERAAPFALDTFAIPAPLATRAVELANVFKVPEPAARMQVDRLNGRRSALVTALKNNAETSTACSHVAEYCRELAELLATKPEEGEKLENQAAIAVQQWTPFVVPKQVKGPEWNSPLAGEVDHFREVHSMGVELAMAKMVQAQLQRRLAAETYEKSGICAEVTTHLRDAAATYEEAAKILDVEKAKNLPGDRCVEWVPATPRILSVICSAESQSVVAVKAEASAKEGSTLTASLHRGAEELFERASAMLKASQSEYNVINQNWQRYLAFGATLCCARSFRAAALATYQDGENIGDAIALNDAARRVLDRGAHIVGARDIPFDKANPATVQSRALSEDKALADAAAARWERENRSVQFKLVPKDTPARPDAKVVV